MKIMLSIFIFLSYISFILCIQSYIEFFNSCPFSTIKIDYSGTNDQFNAEYTATLKSTVAVKSKAFQSEKIIFYWMYKGQESSFILSGNFSFHTIGGNALGYIISSDSICYPMKIELNSTYSDKSTLIFINSATVTKDVYLSQNNENFINYGNILPNPPNDYLISNHEISSEMQDVTIQFRDSNGTVNSDLLESVFIPLDTALFSLNYYIKQDKWGILMFSALGIYYILKFILNLYFLWISNLWIILIIYSYYLANFSSNVNDDFINSDPPKEIASTTDFVEFAIYSAILLCIVVVGFFLLKYYDVISWDPVTQPPPKPSQLPTTNPMALNIPSKKQEAHIVPKSIDDRRYFDSNGMPKDEFIDKHGNLSFNVALATQKNTMLNAEATIKPKRKINGR